MKINARSYGCAARKDRGPAVCGGIEAGYRDVDRIVLDYVRGVDALQRARTRAAVPLPSTIRAQVHALVTGLDVALRTDTARARDALRAMLGN